ncbi:aminopeptidase P family protein [Chelatococcus daeguensis]|uniref:aminopeptidase P family protein n=1 Tax=Chelatococcus daeguensis TaxID=444444 RepID=UPI0007AB6489|nr:aminopeptidase P family protein [Chelatococcus daeguensis]KZE28568.1 X-Pro aminopeptidase [Chelatococcus daeguensis]MBM3083530.1 aminopeptidase P family protein [Chelatococcus daeguensis]
MRQSRFQAFDNDRDPAACGPHLAALRHELRRRGLDGFVVPRADEHQGEYVPPHAERLAWLTGFGGSAGTAVVLMDKAAIFVDGRYTLQVREQVDTELFAPVASNEMPPAAWIGENLPQGAKLGYDPWLHTPAAVDRLARAAEDAGGTLVPVADNPVDAIWSDRPVPPRAPARPYPLIFAGVSAADKLSQLNEKLAKARSDALVVSDPHNLAWLFNLRGADVAHTPLALGYALVPRGGRATIFIDEDKIGTELREALAPLADIASPDTLLAALATAAAGGRRVRLDAATAAAALRETVSAAGGTADVGDDPISLMKAVKNEAEKAGARAAQRRDAVAVTRFLAWFAREAPGGSLTEIDAAVALENFRAETNALVDISFDTIAGAGPNAALPHYHVTMASNRRIGEGIFLIDSGAQYEDGTTDITRTLAVGTPSAEMRERFTRVLKGHIAIATAVFPKGTSGAQLDSFARRPLWEAGLDFDHGTGHGVGAFLSVHEGPHRISKLGTTPLEPGVILSNEPGYYKEGEYGIRIENLVLVEERDIPGADRPMLGFETLTLAPIDLALVEPSLLSDEERAWLDAYHARVREALMPALEGADRAWLVEATRTVGG